MWVPDASGLWSIASGSCARRVRSEKFQRSVGDASTEAGVDHDRGSPEAPQQPLEKWITTRARRVTSEKLQSTTLKLVSMSGAEVEFERPRDCRLNDVRNFVAKRGRLPPRHVQLMLGPRVFGRHEMDLPLDLLGVMKGATLTYVYSRRSFVAKFSLSGPDDEHCGNISEVSRCGLDFDGEHSAHAFSEGSLIKVAFELAEDFTPDCQRLWLVLAHGMQMYGDTCDVDIKLNGHSINPNQPIQLGYPSCLNVCIPKSAVHPGANDLELQYVHGDAVYFLSSVLVEEEEINE